MIKCPDCNSKKLYRIVCAWVGEEYMQYDFLEDDLICCKNCHQEVENETG
jgi:serine protease inhibitor ecotin